MQHLNYIPPFLLTEHTPTAKAASYAPPQTLGPGQVGIQSVSGGWCASGRPLSPIDGWQQKGHSSKDIRVPCKLLLRQVVSEIGH